MDGRGTPLRPRPEIAAARAAMLAWLPAAGGNTHFEQGVLAAFDWVLGNRQSAPLSEVVAAPTSRELVREEQVADDVTYGRPGSPKVAREYAIGVANALMWARGVPDVEPPIDFDYPLAS